MYVAAFFALFTFVGHSIGVISNRALEEVPAFATYQLMKHTTVSFPMGFTRDIATLMLGSNLCLSVYLLIAGLMCVVFGKKAEWSSHDKILVILNSFGLLLTGVISAYFFFPVPAACLVLAAASSAVAITAKS